MSDEELSFAEDEPLNRTILDFENPRWKRYSLRCFWVCGLMQLVLFTGVIVTLNAGSPSPLQLEKASEIAKYVRSAMDRSADPCEDFYQYSCGKWIAGVELSASESRLARSFDTLQMQNEEATLRILEANWPYITTAFELCQNTARLDTRGSWPLQAYYNTIDAASSEEALGRALGNLWLQGLGVDVFFSPYIGVDDMDPQRNKLTLWQSGLSLPDPGYYSDAAMRTELSRWFGTVFAASPHGDITVVQADALVELEQQLAAAFYPASANRDPYAIYNEMSLSSALQLLGPLASFFEPLELSSARLVNVAQLGYFQSLRSLIDAQPLSLLKLYAKLHLFESTFSLLGAEQRATQDEYRRIVYGSEPGDREMGCAGTVTAMFPMLVGKYFAENHTNGEKELALQVLHGIEQSYAQMIDELEWMDSATKAAAQNKLQHIENKIAYPDEWPDFSNLAELVLSDYFELVVSLSALAVEQSLASLDEPVDRSEWGMSPITVNAYYSPNLNEIVFPLGILQFPFFSAGSPGAMNYGGFGVVAGHEISHGFDDSGSQFDAQGFLNDWWSNASRANFEQRVECIEQQYSEYTVSGDNLDGELTAGENIADSGGLESAFRAYQRYKESVSEESLIKKHFDMSGDELFFVSYAQVWCEVLRPEYAQQLLRTNPHSPGKYRVQGGLSDSPHFAETFKCSRQDAYAADTCELW